MSKVIEYRVRSVDRHVITRFERDGDAEGCSELLGEFGNWERAITIAQRLSAGEEGARFIYPGDDHQQLSADDPTIA
jgi:hypothetical protein